MDHKVRVRFAPSPTGPLHIGGARSALFNWLLARKYGGSIMLRIEDTDLERSSRESEENIKESLLWLGLDWDEGIDKGGEYGPYRQTERLDTYRQYSERLLAEGKAYRCYCTEEELEQEREALLAKGEMPRYMGKCRCLTAEDETRLAAEGRKAVIRFRVPEGRAIVVEDLVRGTVSFDSDGIGDFVIVKSDGIPTYNFAVIADDALMGITHVVRGEEHLSNTPRQILLYDALGLKAPQFAHISLILGKDRSKMSKRHGSTSIEAYRSKGYLPEALVNFLALLGWSPEGEEEIFSLDELVAHFSLDRVAKNPAVFDLDKLNWINGMYIRKTPVERLTDMAVPFLREAGYIDEVTPEKHEWLEKIVAAVKDYLANMAEVTDHVQIFFADRLEPVDEAAGEVLKQEEIPQVFNTFIQRIEEVEVLDGPAVQALLKGLMKELNVGGKKVYMPLRVALTGKTHGPELTDIIPILGKEKTVQRVRASLG